MSTPSPLGARPWRPQACAGAAALLAALLAAPAVAAPVAIEYTVTALAQPNRYQYDYTVKNVSLAAPLAWFSIDFDGALYDLNIASFSIASSGVGDWSELLLQSVLGGPVQYDAYNAVGDVAVGSQVSGFSVQFTWLGGPQGPGSQAFTIWDTGTASPLELGFTTAAATPPTGMPEPAGPALVLAGLLAAAAASAATRNRRPPGLTTARPAATRSA